MKSLLRELQLLMKEQNICIEKEENIVFASSGLTKGDLKITIWIFFTVVSFWICWGAIVVATLLLIYFHKTLSNITIRYLVQTIVAINSCINPLLYAFHINHLKQAKSKLFDKILCRNQY